MRAVLDDPKQPQRHIHYYQTGIAAVRNHRPPINKESTKAIEHGAKQPADESMIETGGYQADQPE